MAKVGVVLSGGMAKGAYQIGALKCISEFFSPEDLVCISAASVGILNAYAFATGKMDLAEELWSGLELNSILASYRKLARTSYIYDTVDTLIGKDDCIPCELYTTCFNVSDLKVKYINLKKSDKNKCNKYVRASVCFPFLAKPVVIDDKKYFDGAFVDNIPVAPMNKFDLDYIIVVHFDKKSYIFENENFDRRIIQINYYDDTLIKNSLAFDSASISNMIKVGYQKCKATLDLAFKNGTEDIDTVYSAIKAINEDLSASERRITGDVVLRNINKFVQKFISKGEEKDENETK